MCKRQSVVTPAHMITKACCDVRPHCAIFSFEISKPSAECYRFATAELRAKFSGFEFESKVSFALALGKSGENSREDMLCVH